MPVGVKSETTDLLVLGAGMAGLAVALFSARRGLRITLVERDRPPVEGSADADFAVWERPGVPQRHHGHLFLARSTEILNEEAPDVFAAILARGALALPLGPDEPLGPVLARRPVYEAALRRAAEREPGVTVISGAVVAGLTARGGAVPRITGARLADGRSLNADLVLDATGRASQAAKWLAAIGVRPPPAERHPCGFCYLTRHYRLGEGAPFPTLELPLVAALDFADVAVFPADNRSFALSLVVASGDPLRRRLLVGELFDRFMSAVPLAAPWIAAGRPINRPYPLGRFVNCRRRLVDADGPLASGLILLGDSALGTSPTLGRGTSLAFLQSSCVARLAEAGAAGIDLVAKHDSWAERHLGVWFLSQVAEDKARDRRFNSSRSGEAEDARLGSVVQLIAVLGELRRKDAVVRKATDRVFNLLLEPDAFLRDRQVLRRINASLACRSIVAPAPEGPTRSQFEALLAAAER